MSVYPREEHCRVEQPGGGEGPRVGVQHHRSLIGWGIASGLPRSIAGMSEGTVTDSNSPFGPNGSKTIATKN